jgi:hypothetical protein
MRSMLRDQERKELRTRVVVKIARPSWDRSKERQIPKAPSGCHPALCAGASSMTEATL